MVNLERGLTLRVRKAARSSPGAYCYSPPGNLGQESANRYAETERQPGVDPWAEFGFEQEPGKAMADFALVDPQHVRVAALIEADRFSFAVEAEGRPPPGKILQPGSLRQPHPQVVVEAEE